MQIDLEKNPTFFNSLYPVLLTQLKYEDQPNVTVGIILFKANLCVMKYPYL